MNTYSEISSLLSNTSSCSGLNVTASDILTESTIYELNAIVEESKFSKNIDQVAKKFQVVMQKLTKELTKKYQVKNLSVAAKGAAKEIVALMKNL